MKKVLPYILIAVLLFIGASLYLQFTSKGKKILPVALNDQSNRKLENIEPGDLFKDLGPAPEFAGVNQWLNSNPLTKESLQGKVVLVDFWTYSCINCIRTLPYVTKWYDTYKDDGFVVVGVHTPEFAFEKDADNVLGAIQKYKINYPVALDNDYKTWTAFKNQYWPASYLIDQKGNIVYTHFGEGNYDLTETAIRTLLGKDKNFELPKQEEQNQAQTREIYFGLSRQEVYQGTTEPSLSQRRFEIPLNLKQGYFGLEGLWKFNDEYASLTEGPGKIRLNFNSAKVFMVAKSEKINKLKVLVDGNLFKEVSVQGYDLYELYNSNLGGNHTLEIEIPDAGFESYTFTFG